MQLRWPCLAAVLLVQACSADPTCQELANCPVGPGDGGDASDGAPPVEPSVRLSLEQPTYALQRGRTQRVGITLDRGAGYTGPVIVTAQGLPVGILSAPITVLANELSGGLSFAIAKEVPLGPIRGVTIRATNPARTWEASVALDAHVRPPAGELDATFGANGVLNGATETGVAPSGEIYVADANSLFRYTKDGVLDTQFGTGGKVSFGDYLIPTRVIATTTSVYVARMTHSPAKGIVLKYTSTGQLDRGFSGGKGSIVHDDSISVFEVAPDNRSVILNRDQSTVYYWRSPTGDPDPNVAGGKTMLGTSITTAALYLSDGVVVVGREGLFQKVKAIGGQLDPAFGGQATGYRKIDGGPTLFDIVQDSQGRFLLTGVTSTRALILVRTKPDGVADTTMQPVVSPFVVKPQDADYVTPGLAGRLAVQKDGKILQAAQIEQEGTVKCVVARYDADGKVDTAFGNDGKVILGQADCVARRVHTQPDGRILLSGDHVFRIWD